MASSSFMFLRLLVIFYSALAAAVSQEPLVVAKATYKAGDAIPVSCLNRTV